MSITSRYMTWRWRPGGPKVKQWEAARAWAEAMNEAMNSLPQHQQDQLDAMLRNKVTGP